MFKKFASVLLAASMIAGATAAVSAAETTDTDAVAADDSSAVSADSSSEVSANSKVFYFDVASCGDGWKNYADNNKSKVFCHIYSYDGTGTWTDWQLKSEKCSYDSETGIATYDIQTGIDKGATSLSDISSDSKYLIMFSLGSGSETYPILMNSSCFGDTVVAIDGTTMYENNVDSEKKSLAMKWKNSNLGAAITITSTSKIQGSSLAYGETNETVLASYLKDYGETQDKVSKDILQSLFNQLNVSVKNVATITGAKLQEALKADKITQDEYNAKLSGVTAALAEVTDPTTGSTVSKDDIQSGAEEGSKAVESGSSVSDVTSKNSGSSSSSSSSSSNKTSTTSSSKSTTSSTSNSVKSGQDSTIFFVFGGVMIAAVGVIFLTRKKREF
jgi:LPXTG-motif cell wall-anchored protein